MYWYDLSFIVPVRFSSGYWARQGSRPQIVRFIRLTRDMSDYFYIMSLAESADQLVGMEFAPSDSGPIYRQYIADLQALDPLYVQVVSSIDRGTPPRRALLVLMKVFSLPMRAAFVMILPDRATHFVAKYLFRKSAPSSRTVRALIFDPCDRSPGREIFEALGRIEVHTLQPQIERAFATVESA